MDRSDKATLRSEVGRRWQSALVGCITYVCAYVTIGGFRSGELSAGLVLSKLLEAVPFVLCYLFASFLIARRLARREREHRQREEHWHQLLNHDVGGSPAEGACGKQATKYDLPHVRRD